VKKSIIMGVISLLCLTSGVVYVSLKDKQASDTEPLMMATNPTANSLSIPAENTAQPAQNYAQSRQTETDTAALNSLEREASVEGKTDLVIPPITSETERAATRAVREEYLPVYLKMVDDNIAELTDKIAISKKKGVSSSEIAMLEKEIAELNKMKKEVLVRNKDVTK
jgi:hypothetical protein